MVAHDSEKVVRLRPQYAKIGRIYDALVNRAQRYAVLAPLTGSGTVFKAAEIRRGLREVQLMRFERVKELYQHDWEPLYKQSPSLMIRCPPFGCETDTTWLPCRRPMFCPNCWARMIVRDAFLRLEWAIYGTNKLIHREPELGMVIATPPLSFDILEVQNSELVPGVDDVRRLFRAGRDLFVSQKVFRHGNLHLVTAEPQDGQWLVRTRGLIIVPYGETPAWRPTDKKGHYSIKHNGRTYELRRNPIPAKRESLVACVGRVCQFPVGMLTGNAKAVAELLNKKEKYEKRYGSRGRLRTLAARARRINDYPLEETRRWRKDANSNHTADTVSEEAD